MADSILKLSRNLIKLDTNKDFFSDQIHYQITFTVLIISAIASTSLQFYADPIQCIQPAQFTDGYTSFARTICWLNNTYFYPQTYLRLPLNKTERVEHTLKYYQWLPFVYLIQAFLFLFPHLIWISFYKRNGLNPGILVDQGEKFEKNQQISQRIAREIERYLMCKQLATYKKKLLLQHNLHRTTSSDTPLVLPNIPFRVRYRNYYLVTLYLAVKFLYLLNIIVQVCILNVILSIGNYRFIHFGYDTLKYLFRSSLRERISELSYEHQQLFPFVTLCDFNIRELGQDHFYTIECILLINIFYEKIYFAIWIWFVILFVVTLISLAYSFSNYVPFFIRFRYISRLLHYARLQHIHRSVARSPPPMTTMEGGGGEEDKKDFLDDIDRRRDFVQWLQRDGVFLLHLIQSHHGEKLIINCIEDLKQIWLDNYEYKSQLAEKLLHNTFHFH